MCSTFYMGMLNQYYRTHAQGHPKGTTVYVKSFSDDNSGVEVPR